MIMPNLVKSLRIFTISLVAALFAGFLHTTPALAEQQFTDPYGGGEHLPKGGGAPGAAYLAFVDAAKQKDLGRMCEMIAGPAMKDKCLENSALVDGYAYYLAQPERQEVLEGYRKGDEATLNVAFTNPSAPTSTGYVVMAQVEGRWALTKFGGSGSGTVSAQAEGRVDFDSRGDEKPVATGPVVPKEGPLLGTWVFEGKDAKGVVWKGTLTITALDAQDYDGVKYHSQCEINASSANSSNGVGSTCTWDKSMSEVALLVGETVAYQAKLSPDRKSLTNGKWTEGEKDWSTGKVKVLKSGIWSAKYKSP